MVEIHLFLMLWSIGAAWLLGDWKKWDEYYPTLLYFSLMSLLYEFFANDYYRLWTLEPDFFFNSTTVVLVHSFVIYPLTGFIFLSTFPDLRKKQIIHYLKWFFIYIGLEWIGMKLGYITYDNEWAFWWSFFFVIVMFPMIKLHHVRKNVALGISIFWIMFFLVVFRFYGWSLPFLT